MPDGVFEWFLNQGILGIICLVLGAVVWHLWGQLKEAPKERAKAVAEVESLRHEDKKEHLNILNRQNSLTKELIKEVNQMMLDQVRSNDKVVATMVAQEKAFGEQERASEKLVDAIDKLRIEQTTFMATKKERT